MNSTWTAGGPPRRAAAGAPGPGGPGGPGSTVGPISPAGPVGVRPPGPSGAGPVTGIPTVVTEARPTIAVGDPRAEPSGGPSPAPSSETRGSAAMAVFGGGGAEEAPLTWGQTAVWRSIARTGNDDRRFRFHRVLALAGHGRPATVTRVTAALGALMTRHESLRTRLRIPGAGARPRQVRSGCGGLRVTVVDVATAGAGAGAADTLLARLGACGFDHQREWPIRAGLVVHGEQVTHVVLVLCSMATDSRGADIAVRDLRLLIRRGSAGPPPKTGPLALAREQRSPAGVRRTEEALAHWRVPVPVPVPGSGSVPVPGRAGAAVPGARDTAAFGGRPVAPAPAAPAVLPPAVWPAGSACLPGPWDAGAPEAAGPPCGVPAGGLGPPTARLVSGALARATDVVALGAGLTPSVVLLAASAVLTARMRGDDTAVLSPILANRSRNVERDLVSPLSQHGLYVLTFDPASRFTDLLNDAARAAARAERGAAYDPDALDTLDPLGTCGAFGTCGAPGGPGATGSAGSAGSPRPDGPRNAGAPPVWSGAVSPYPCFDGTRLADRPPLRNGVCAPLSPDALRQPGRIDFPSVVRDRCTCYLMRIAADGDALAVTVTLGRGVGTASGPAVAGGERDGRPCSGRVRGGVLGAVPRRGVAPGASGGPAAHADGNAGRVPASHLRAFEDLIVRAATGREVPVGELTGWEPLG